MPDTVIKARTLASLNRPAIIKRNVELAGQRADEIIGEARREAAQIADRAQLEAQELLDSAKREGYASGLAHWNETLASAWKNRDEYIAGNEPALLQLAVKIAEKLIGEELRTSPETIAGIVREALRSAARARTFVIQAHPADVSLLNERIAQLRGLVGSPRAIEIVSNHSLARGDCVVESDIGIIDARLETQLKNMERLLTGTGLA